MAEEAEGGRGYLFQGRFSSSVLDEGHLLAAAAYVELNPVRAGIVNKAWVYRWSSASFPMGRSRRDPLGKDGRWRDWVKKWAEFLPGATRAKDQAIRQMTRTGRPAGNAAFVDLVERLMDRDLSKDKPGTPVTKDK